MVNGTICNIHLEIHEGSANFNVSIKIYLADSELDIISIPPEFIS